MSTNHTPWRLEQPEQWPFDLLIVDGNGAELLRDRRYTHSTGDKSVADAMECRHHGKDRAEAAAANQAQVDCLNFIVRAVNSHDALVEAVRAFIEYDNDDEDETGLEMMVKYDRALACAKRAINLVGGN